MRRLAIAAVVMLAGSPGRTVFAQTKSVALDLSGAGVKAVIQAPEGAKAKEFLSTTRVSNGPHFSVEITPIYPMEFGAARDAAKMETKAKFLVDTPDTLVWESDGAPGAHSSHFYTTVKVGAKLHACFDTRGSGDYSKAEVDAMLAACRTLKAK
jgi:hypothetical protein